VVKENGTHEQLLALNGIYARLHQTQFDEQASKAPAPASALEPPPVV
jgi:hypothetical protein